MIDNILTVLFLIVGPVVFILWMLSAQLAPILEG